MGEATAGFVILQHEFDFSLNGFIVIIVTQCQSIIQGIIQLIIEL